MGATETKEGETIEHDGAVFAQGLQDAWIKLF